MLFLDAGDHKNMPKNMSIVQCLAGLLSNRCLAISSSDLFETENTLTEINSFPSSLNYF